MVKITRRNFLALGGAAAVGVTVGAVGAGAAISGRTGAGQPVRQSPVTFDSWLRTRRAPYAIAHRGVGDVAPEHTLPSYQMALDYGASCLEISVVMSADKV